MPVYDYVLMTEPLTPRQLDAIGWSRRQALADAGSMFHYYRLGDDQRILWGGWDAFCHYGSRIAAEIEERPGVQAKLTAHFFTTFLQLEGLRFTLTRRSTAHAELHGSRRNAWLRTLDRFGLRLDS